MAMKHCSSCKQSKPLDEFNRARKECDGRQSRCRECGNQAMREYRQTEKGKTVLRQGQKRYAKTKKGKAARRRYQASRYTKGNGLDRWVEKIAREAEEET